MSHTPGACPICKKAFKEGDDVVICPSCGAPYHRECYKKEGHCVFETQHGPNFEYVAPGAEKKAPDAAEEKTAQGDAGGAKRAEEPSGILCPACGTVNDGQGIFCERCGAALHGDARKARPGAGGPAASPLGGMQGAFAAEIDGIPQADWANYIGNAAPIYLARLTQMQQRNSKLSMTFSAFFVSPFYFAYRKMWGWAVLALVTMLLMTTAQVALIAADAGNPMLPWIPYDVLYNISTIGYYVYLATRVLFGLFAVQLYRQKARKKIRALRAQHEAGADYRDALVRAGGVSTVGLVVALVLFTGASMLLGYYVGDDVMAYLTTAF